MNEQVRGQIEAISQAEVPVRLCLLGLGGGGFSAQVARCVNQIPGNIEIVAINSGLSMEVDLSVFKHSILRCYAVRSPSLYGDSVWKTVKEFVSNIRSAWRILRKERPKLILSFGTSQAIPFGIVGRLHGIPLWHVESLTRVNNPSRTGRWVYRLGVCQRFYYYWPELSPCYPRGILAGGDE
jgi:UDP-N-acetylglucosamine:LPS N-acetylglucosamine transferase